jgi:circadian clock protein KaiB
MYRQSGRSLFNFAEPAASEGMNGAQTSEHRQQGSPNEPWHVRLYIAGWTPSSLAALRSVKEIESEYFPPGSTVEIVDLIEHPQAGIQDNVLAIPTMVRLHPKPVRRIVGSFSDIPKALKILGFPAAA